MITPLLLATGLLTLTQTPANPPTPNSTRAAHEAARDQADRDASAQAQPAQWCESRNLAEDAEAHHAMMLRFDPAANRRDGSSATRRMAIVG